MTISDGAALRGSVLEWYRANARPLAFRGTTDPWAILVSEFMAQQTQAARAAEAWTGFVATYPTAAAFAAASPADALRAWRGLGYNRRALALLRTARAIVEDHGGRVPGDLVALQRLPGVGPYTARAIAALAFDAPVGAVDTNVRRVLSRALFDEAPSVRELQDAADELVPADRPGEWTHAVMDVGATFCRPRNPRCETCPVRPWCRYAARAMAADGAQRPVRPASAKAPGATPRFESTSRWLRGRILERLRDAPPQRWVVFNASIGTHPSAVIEQSIDKMSAEGLLEVRARRPLAARLPHGHEVAG